MLLGRTHRAPMRFPIHFTAPDRSKTYIGETIDISSNGFSVQVTTPDPLPTIILSGILPSDIAGDSILCKARIVWQGGLAGGIKRASFKITSIARKSQERLDTLIQSSIESTVGRLQDLSIFSAIPPADLRTLLRLTRMRELQSDQILYEKDAPHNCGIFIILEGSIISGNRSEQTTTFGPGSVIGQLPDSKTPPRPESVQIKSCLKVLHLPQSLIPEIEQELPSIIQILIDSVGQPVIETTPPASSTNRRKLKQNILKNIQEIPTLPAVFNAIMDCVEDPEATPRDLALIIRKDQALSVKILKTTNSALYGFSRHITSVDEAIVLLGMNQTANLAITTMLLNTLCESTAPGRKPEDFWIHSLGTAYLAQAIGEYIQNKQSIGKKWTVKTHSAKHPSALTGHQNGDTELKPRLRAPLKSATTAEPRRNSIPFEKLFTYSIVHDIGLIALYLQFPEHYITVYDAIPEYGSFHQAELELLEIDHCQFGYRIAQAWRLPEPIPTLIAEHHLPQLWENEITDHDQMCSLLKEDPLVTLVSLAELLTRHGEIGVQLDANPPTIPGALLETLGLDEEDLAEILTQIDQIREKSEAFFASMAG